MNSTLLLDKVSDAPTRARVEDGHVVASVTLVDADGSELTLEASTKDDIGRLARAALALAAEFDSAQAALVSTLDLRDGIRP